MENITLEMLFKRISNLEKRLEQYYNYLKIENELDFILKGTYIFKENVISIIDGTY